MPDFFEFKRDNGYVRERLSLGEIGGVIRWQNDRQNYQFSFHTQHEAGWPCYLSEPGGPGRNLPKINLKVPTNPIQILQGASIVDNTNGADFRDVITANLALFQKLARLYYEGTVQQEIRRPTWVVFYKCTTARQAKPIGVKLPSDAQIIGETFWSNFRHLAKTPNCPLHRRQDCLVPELVSVAATDIADITKRFDRNGDVQDEV